MVMAAMLQLLHCGMSVSPSARRGQPTNRLAPLPENPPCFREKKRYVRCASRSAFLGSPAFFCLKMGKF